MTQAQEAAPTSKPRKPRLRPKTGVEKRLEAGAVILKSMTKDGVAWTFADTGKAARADVCERLRASGKLVPRRDGLFASDSQTWGLG